VRKVGAIEISVTPNEDRVGMIKEKPRDRQEIGKGGRPTAKECSVARGDQGEQGQKEKMGNQLLSEVDLALQKTGVGKRPGRQRHHG